ncbi:uncharacterized protein TRUGW13939_03425 [Talaromyces rugulosus]|uniref:Uncharacterized protein n=1 Tax=Talaromyces rugulosus TaxID=121627 RepID=A0A7H8QQS3_TALRU|nr:uncharacterized protein TRUGW13939_03425 [Talaromyces rugulosus]QKX56324.1 hypothetical protein TRUGW13939_03425 [Talaromyces rugulosus]
MGQIIDLGTGTFKNIRQEHCLLSRTTVTLEFQNDAAYHTNQITDAVDMKAIWVTVKRELTVNLRLETSWRLVRSLPAVVEQLVDTMERILVSSRSADNVAVHVSITLCESFDRPRDSLRGKLPPRLVRGCILIDASPPPEITIGTLSNITIHLKSPVSCSPWDMCLTKMWLQDFPPNLSTHGHSVGLSHSSKNHHIISLRPHHIFPLRSSHDQPPFGQNAGCESTNKQSSRSSDKYLNSNFGRIPENSWEFGSLLDYSIRSLILLQPRRCIEGLSESRSADSFSLSEVAPLAFSPGYYDNIRYRAGLLPVVTKSIGLLFRKSSSHTLMMQDTTTWARLKELCGHSSSIEVNDLRPLIRSAMWNALQRGVYKTRSATLPTNLVTDSLANDTMLMEEWDAWPESDEEILSSYENSVPLSMGSYVPLSQRPLRYFPEEEVNGYEHKIDSAIFEWENSDYECDFNSQVHDERRESICWSSSLNLGTTSDITIDNAISCGTAPLCESVAYSKYSKTYGASSIMEDSTSLPILSASPSTIGSALHDIPLTPTSTADGENIDIIISDSGHHLNEDTASIGDFLAI